MLQQIQSQPQQSHPDLINRAWNFNEHLAADFSFAVLLWHQDPSDDTVDVQVTDEGKLGDRTYQGGDPDCLCVNVEAHGLDWKARRLLGQKKKKKKSPAGVAGMTGCCQVHSYPKMCYAAGVSRQELQDVRLAEQSCTECCGKLVVGNFRYRAMWGRMG